MKQSSLLPDGVTGPGFIEAWARTSGYLPVLGVDEVGRGCLAGPVVAAAVILPDDFDSQGIDDSKSISLRERHRLDLHIRSGALALGLGQIEAAQIDRLGILAATLTAMRSAIDQAIQSGTARPGIVIVDGISTIPNLALLQRAWPKGDHLSLNCAAASIVAKVFRDRLMNDLDATWPQYGFARHKGYGTAEHLAALQALGPCPLHRRSFAPLKTRLR